MNRLFLLKKISTSSSYFIRTTWTATPQTISKITYKQSSIPYTYIHEEMDAAMDLESFKDSKKEIFEMTQPRYITPVEFGYQLPRTNIPEYAFIGRSNVGKSSLVNVLLGNSKLVRVSKTPGCTQSVNYYALEKSKQAPVIYLVDLPGYGFAKASKTDRAAWRTTITGYLHSRMQGTLRRVFLLVDGRHGLKTSDIEMMNLLDEAVLPYQIVLTKSDVAKPAEMKLALQSAFDELGSKKANHIALPVVHTVSSKSLTGIDTLMLIIAELNSYKWANPFSPQDLLNPNSQVSTPTPTDSA